MDKFELSYLYSNRSRANFKELLGIIENEFDHKIFIIYSTMS